MTRTPESTSPAIVGGIQANNTLCADFIYQNLMVEANLVHGAWQDFLVRHSG